MFKCSLKSHLNYFFLNLSNLLFDTDLYPYFITSKKKYSLEQWIHVLASRERSRTSFAPDLFSQIMPPAKPRHAERMQQVQEGLPAQLFLGTTSWSNADWEGLIYPAGCAAADYIDDYNLSELDGD